MGAELFYTEEIKSKIAEVYQTAKTHREAALKCREVGLNLSSHSLQVATSKFKISRPCLQWGGVR
jgi:hypothetical protein